MYKHLTVGYAASNRVTYSEKEDFILDPSFTTGNQHHNNTRGTSSDEAQPQSGAQAHKAIFAGKIIGSDSYLDDIPNYSIPPKHHYARSQISHIYIALCPLWSGFSACVSRRISSGNANHLQGRKTVWRTVDKTSLLRRPPLMRLVLPL
jgi:hypothetical protein